MMIISFINRKAGIGKSTPGVNWASCLAWAEGNVGGYGAAIKCPIASWVLYPQIYQALKCNRLNLLRNVKALLYLSNENEYPNWKYSPSTFQ